MKKNYASKTIIIYILLILQTYTSKEHPVSYSELAAYLRSKGKPCDRKTVARNVDYLIADNFSVFKTAGGKCFYDKAKSKTDKKP